MPHVIETGTTRKLLEALASHGYPTIISTKSDLVASPEFTELLCSGRFAVQFSFSSPDDAFARDVDSGTPNPTSRIAAAETLSKHGIPVGFRHQPLFPGREREILELMRQASGVGASHYAVEYYKHPAELSWIHRDRLNSALGFDLDEFYRKLNSRRSGREWILPVEYRLDAILSAREQAHTFGLSFGAADSDLLHLSDGEVCCSGADILGFGGGLRFNFLTAVRKGLQTGAVRFESIRDEWRPQGSIAHFVNSTSRRDSRTVTDYIQRRWNGVTSGPSPAAFYGVEATQDFDDDGFRIYTVSDRVQALRSERIC